MSPLGIGLDSNEIEMRAGERTGGPLTSAPSGSLINLLYVRAFVTPQGRPPSPVQNFRHLILVRSPMEIANAHEFCTTRGLKDSETKWVVPMSGETNWDSQILDSVHRLSLGNVLFLTNSRAGQTRLTRVLSRGNKAATNWRILRAPFGRPVFAKMLTILQLRMDYRLRGPKVRHLETLVSGNARDLWPFLNWLLDEHSTVVLVDEGLATLAWARNRREQADLNKPRRETSAWRPVIHWRRDLVFYTLFPELKFHPSDRILENKSFSRLEQPIKVVPKTCWVLGKAVVELWDESPSAYKDVLQAIDVALHTAGFRGEYMPHRREEEANIALALDGLGITRASWRGPVEFRVLHNFVAPKLIIGFGSSALHLLARFIPRTCELVSVRMEFPQETRPWRTHVYDHFIAHPRVRVLTAGDLINWTPTS